MSQAIVIPNKERQVLLVKGRIAIEKAIENHKNTRKKRKRMNIKKH
jgi:hypothetical protein